MKTKTIILAALAAATLCICMPSCSSIFKPLDEPGLEIGDSVPEFEYTTIYGEKVNNDTFSAAPFAILVMKPDCGFCQSLINQIMRIWPQVNDVPLLMLSYSETNTTLSFVEENQLPWPTACLDSIKEVSKFTGTTLPTLLLFDESAVVRLRISRDIISDEELLQGFNSLKNSTENLPEGTGE